MERSFARFPASLPATHRRGARYLIDPSRFALQGELPAGLEAFVEDRLADDAITVLRTPRRETAAAASPAAVPVYVLGIGGAAFVPTGRVTVRFRDDIDAASRGDALRELGYRVTDVPAYAPHMAWVEAVTGDVAAALAGLERLAALPDVEHVEPQLLTAGERR